MFHLFELSNTRLGIPSSRGSCQSRCMSCELLAPVYTFGCFVLRKFGAPRQSGVLQPNSSTPQRSKSWQLLPGILAMHTPILGIFGPAQFFLPKLSTAHPPPPPHTASTCVHRLVSPVVQHTCLVGLSPYQILFICSSKKTQWGFRGV